MTAIATRGKRFLAAVLSGALALGLSALVPTTAQAVVPANVIIRMSDADLAHMSDKSYWWNEGGGSRSLVKFVEKGSVLSFTYKVTDAVAPNAPVEGATVTLDALSPTTNSSFTGSLSGVTNANGEVTFSLTNTNSAAEPRPVAPSTMDYWDDTRVVSPEYKFDMVPSVTGATSTNRDRLWTHIVNTAAPVIPASVNIKLSDADVAHMSDKSYWWSEGNGSRSLVKFVSQGSTLSFTYKVTDATAPNAAVAGATVTLDAQSPTTNSSFTGSLTGVTDSNGLVTFNLTNTNTAAEPRPVAPSTMDYWDDTRTVSPEYKFDIVPSVTGATSTNRDRIWTHTVEAVGVNIKLKDSDVAHMSDKSYWWNEGNGSRSLVKFIEKGGVLSFTYVVTEAAAGNAPVAGAEVTLDATSATQNSSFTGSLTGTTNASGEVTFTLNNTNSAAEPRPVAPSTMDYWDDTRTVSPEYKFDIVPSVTGAVSTNRDRIWGHIVQPLVNIKLSAADVAHMSDKSYWWNEGNGSRSLVKFAEKGRTLTFTYTVTMADGGAPVAGAEVTLDAVSPTQNSSFTGSLTGTTNASGEVTFTLTNTNTDAEPRPVAPSSMDYWDDSRTVSPEYKFDMTPSVTGAVSINRDRIWSHIVVRSANAALSGLSVSSNFITRDFDTDMTEHSLGVSNVVNSLNITAVTSDADATITINNVAADSDTATPVALAVGANVINVVVTAADGTTTRTYTLTVTRAAAVVAPITISVTGSAGMIKVNLSGVEGKKIYVVRQNGADSLKLTRMASSSSKSIVMHPRTKGTFKVTVRVGIKNVTFTVKVS